MGGRWLGAHQPWKGVACPCFEMAVEMTRAPSNRRICRRAGRPSDLARRRPLPLLPPRRPPDPRSTSWLRRRAPGLSCPRCAPSHERLLSLSCLPRPPSSPHLVHAHVVGWQYGITPRVPWSFDFFFISDFLCSWCGVVRLPARRRTSTVCCAACCQCTKMRDALCYR